MKRVTFCLVCGATPPADASRCHDCGAPLHRKGRRPRIRLPRFSRPGPLTLMVVLAAVAVIVAAITFLLTT